ncbi:MAG: hypothetical protein AAGE84_23610 [Cyanobacteria bacterium P01_G01_bin.39]
MKINLSIITLSIGLTLSIAAYVGVTEARASNSTAVNSFSNQLPNIDRHLS